MRISEVSLYYTVDSQINVTGKYLGKQDRQAHGIWANQYMLDKGSCHK